MYRRTSLVRPRIVLSSLGKAVREFCDRRALLVEKLTYRLLGIDPDKEQSWLQYTIALLVFTAVTVLFTYGILRLQGFLPLNQDPKTFQAVTDHLAFNTAISFSTNTNWQSYSGESTMSYFSQMVGLALHNFMSAAAGIAVAAAVVRGIARHTAKTIGNFWVDLVRITYYLLLPICFFYALSLVWQGVPQNFKPYQTAKVVEAQKVQVQKKDANGNPVNDAKGNPVLVYFSTNAASKIDPVSCPITNMAFVAIKVGRRSVFIATPGRGESHCICGTRHEEKEEGENALGLDGEKDFSPEEAKRMFTRIGRSIVSAPVIRASCPEPA